MKGGRRGSGLSQESGLNCVNMIAIVRYSGLFQHSSGQLNQKHQGNNMQQTAPKFMAQVKAKFVAPDAQSDPAPAMQQHQVQQQQPSGRQNLKQRRQQRVPQGNAGSSGGQASLQFALSGSHSHRQMPNQEPSSAMGQQPQLQAQAQSNAAIQPFNTDTMQTPTAQKIQLQRMAHHTQSAYPSQRELSGMKAVSDGSNLLFGNNANPQTHNNPSNQMIVHEDEGLHQGLQQPQQSHQMNSQANLNSAPRLFHQSQQYEVNQFDQGMEPGAEMNAVQFIQQHPSQQVVTPAAMMDPAQQRQYALSQNQMQMFQHLQPNTPQYTAALQNRSPTENPQLLTQPPQSPVQMSFPGELSAAALATQYTQIPSQQQQPRTNTMLMGYNTGGRVSNDVSGFQTHQAQTPAELSTQNLATYESMGVDMTVQQQKAATYALNMQQLMQEPQLQEGEPIEAKPAINTRQGNKRSSGRQKDNLNILTQDVMTQQTNNQSKTPLTATNKRASAMSHQTSSLLRPQGNANNHGRPAAQVSANLNLMKQLYSAKGGVQTPPANLRGSCSSVGSRRQSGESSGMLSMGSVGTNFNEGSSLGGEIVQKPLVREFKTQDRLNKGMMPGQTTASEETAMPKPSSTNHRKANAIAVNLTKKQSPKPNAMSQLSANQQHSARPRQHIKRPHQNTVISQRDLPGLLIQNTAANQAQPHASARQQTKKFKSVSESNAMGSTIKSGKLKSMMKQQVQPDLDPAAFHPPSTAQEQHPLPDEPDTIQIQTIQTKYEHPEQPGDDISPPDMTVKSQTIRMHNSEEHQIADKHNDSKISPTKQSFQQSSNQDAIERNEELMSLLACLNEQAIKELGAQQETEWDTGMQRLLKAYKIMVETKNPNSFDANYKAIICYNLACCCQMQGELQDCSKYLTKAIEFVSTKLDTIKESAVSHYNQSQQQSQQLCNTTLEQQSLTITSSSITTNEVKKNSDIFADKKTRAGQTRGGAPSGQAHIQSNRSAQPHLTGAKSRYGAIGKQPTVQSSRNGYQAGSSRLTASGQRVNLKSPHRQGEAPMRGGRSNAGAGGANRPLGATQTQNSLFSDFSRLANANQRQKASQQQLRTLSSNQNQLKPRSGIGSTTSKNNAQSQAQFTKAGGSLLSSGVASTPQTRGSKTGSNVPSDQKRGSGRNAYMPTGGQVAGQPQTICVNQENFLNTGRNIRDGNKKAHKVQLVQVENWLDCYNSMKNRPPRELLERSIHLTRYYCRFVLQLCAVLSQLNLHEQALSFSKKASGLASELTEMTLILIKEETKANAQQQKQSLQDTTSAFNDGSSQKPKRRKHSTSNQLDPYNSSQLSKQKTTVSARFNHQVSGGGKGGSQNSSLVHSNLGNQPVPKDRVQQSYTMSNLNQLGGSSGRDMQSSSTNMLNNSGLALSYFPTANPEQAKNERESLERIHTFSLKEPAMDLNASDDQFGGAQTLTGNFLDPLLADHRNNKNDAGENRQNLSMEAPFSGTRQRGISEGSRNSSTTSNRSCSQYVPERVKIFQKQINKTHDIVYELISIQKEFRSISELNFKERRDFFQDRMAEKKRLKISFQTYEEMNKLQIEQKFKITARSALGVKNFSNDDWIFSFNIGNIMHLQTLGFDELANAKTSQSLMNNPPSNGMNAMQITRDTTMQRAGIQGSVTTQQSIRNYLMSEISKDQLLYKSLYVIVSYFCIGTELRFLATLNPQRYNLKDSEIWHAKAIHIASYFMPNDCPLIQHITQSYAKHHLRPKIKRRQDQLASLASYQ